ncbi:MAG TPA: NfeD family protein [Polyangiaceae bacterium]
MLLVYVGALLASLGVVALQIFAGHDTDADHDVSHGDVNHDVGFWFVFTSVRFWAFAFLSFGIIGTLSTLLQLAPKSITLAVAIVSGLVFGTTAAFAMRKIKMQQASSHKRVDEIVGRLGRVIIPLTGSVGKVRVEVKGTIGDYAARATEPIAEGETVIVEEYDGSEAVVSKAPKDLEP